MLHILQGNLAAYSGRAYAQIFYMSQEDICTLTSDGCNVGAAGIKIRHRIISVGIRICTPLT